MKDGKKKSAENKYPHRAPLILSYEEATYLMLLLSDQVDAMTKLRPSSKFGVHRLSMLRNLRNKFYKI